MRNILSILKAWYESFFGNGYTHDEYKDLYYVDEENGREVCG
jgi:hypothetical protein